MGEVELQKNTHCIRNLHGPLQPAAMLTASKRDFQCGLPEPGNRPGVSAVQCYQPKETTAKPRGRTWLGRKAMTRGGIRSSQLKAARSPGAREGHSTVLPACTQAPSLALHREHSIVLLPKHECTSLLLWVSIWTASRQTLAFSKVSPHFWFLVHFMFQHSEVEFQPVFF